MLSILGLLAACMGDATGPEANTSSIPVTPAAFRIIPSAVTVETNQPVRFRSENHSRRRSYTSALTWLSSGGSISADGTFSSETPGTYKVTGRGRGRQKADTAIVVVVPPMPDLTGVEISPSAVTLASGTTHAFAAVGRLADSSTAPVGVTWTATGGSVDPSGTYTAGSVAGVFRVVATNTAGTLADTAQVTIGLATSPLATLILKPASVTLATGTTRQFEAFGRTAGGDSVSVAVTFSATGGTITSSGLYTAGATSGSFRIVAAADGLADTAAVTLTRTLTSGTAAAGRPMGMSGLVASGVSPGPFGMSLDGYTSTNIVTRINEARTRKMRLLLNLTGGSHDRYKTDGVFDMGKWKAKMETYNTPTIKAAVAAGVADGTIVGSSVMDEPHNSTDLSGWGGVLTKSTIDGMCGYVKAMFPTLTVGVVHDHRQFEPEKNYRVCDFVLSQYRLSKGSVTEFRDGGLAFAQRSGIGIIFSLNVLHGGTPSTTCDKYGRDASGMLCPMSASQIRDFGWTLGSAGCALNMWRYEQAYYDKPEIQQAFRDLAARLATLPAKVCGRA